MINDIFSININNSYIYICLLYQKKAVNCCFFLIILYFHHNKNKLILNIVNFSESKINLLTKLVKSLSISKEFSFII